MSPAQSFTAVSVVAILGLSGCGVSAGEATYADRKSSVVSPKASQPSDRPVLPRRPGGLIEIDGATRGSLVADAVGSYEHAGVRSRISVANSGEESAFQALCAGSIDMVDSARPISDAELETCVANGLELVQFQIASDAVVLAIKSESDVGADCLHVDQVEETFRAGSQVANWSDLGMDDVPMLVGGPDVENNAFGFFGAEVLQAPEPSMAYLRSDYHGFDNDQGTREFVVGTAKDEGRARKLPGRQATLVSARRVVEEAEAAMPALSAELAAAEAERTKGIRDNRSLTDQGRDQARLDAARTALRSARRDLRAARTVRREASAAVRNSKAAEGRRYNARGHLAYFRFTYYETFEDQLRPFEISGPGQKCVFPSQSTITGGQYPLARQLLVTTTRTALSRADIRSFLTHHLKTSRDMAESARLVPLPVSVVSRQLSWLDDPRSAPHVSPVDGATEDEDSKPAVEVPVR